MALNYRYRLVDFGLAMKVPGSSNSLLGKVCVSFMHVFGSHHHIQFQKHALESSTVSISGNIT